MQQLTYINSIGAELVLTNSAPFLLQEFDENENLNIYNFKGSGQDGKSYLGSTLDVKDLSIKFVVIASTKIELIEYRNRIFKTFNPKLGEGYLVYKDDLKEHKIKCIVNKLPFFTTLPNSNGCVSTCLISMTANNPCWTDLIDIKKEIALWKSNLEFSLELVSGGIEMGYREPSLIVDIINEGDIECGMRIEFEAMATVVDPSLLDVNTGKLIKLNRTMIAGEIINIVTDFGNKKITSTINGITTNIFNYIDINSEFLQLSVGDNLFRYDAVSGIDNLSVSIYYMPKYLGV